MWFNRRGVFPEGMHDPGDSRHRISQVPFLRDIGVYTVTRTQKRATLTGLSFTNCMVFFVTVYFCNLCSTPFLARDAAYAHRNHKHRRNVTKIRICFSSGIIYVFIYVTYTGVVYAWCDFPTGSNKHTHIINFAVCNTIYLQRSNNPGTFPNKGNDCSSKTTNTRNNKCYKCVYGEYLHHTSVCYSYWLLLKPPTQQVLLVTTFMTIINCYTPVMRKWLRACLV
jgi:hypothetical protein